MGGILCRVILSPSSVSVIPHPIAKQVSALEAKLEPVFAKFPHLTTPVRQTLVNIAPWLALISGLIGLLAIFSGGMLMSVLTLRFFGSGIIQLPFVISMIVGLLASALDLLAYTPLAAHKKLGWDYIFTGTVLMALAMIIDLVMGSGSLGGLIGQLIGVWLLFEVRGLYH
jgi:uncharacterized BrkB/YihY/UPF0761 family membrane protein